MPKSLPDTPSGPKALGPYSMAAEANGFVFLAGQVALDPATGTKVEGDVVAQAERVLQNIGLLLSDVGLDYSDVVKAMVFLADIADFAAVNEVYAKYFSSEPPARSTFQAGALPGGYLVEIEVIAAR